MNPPPRPKTSEDVHIIPLAREVDRAVLPFLPRRGRPAVLHAHRIILLVPDGSHARRIATKVEKALSAVATVERQPLAADREHPTAGFQGILQQVSWFIKRELALGNRVHVNLSSGSKLVAFAAGLAGMAHLRTGAGTMYYVQPVGYTLSEEEFEEHGHTLGVLDVEELDLMPVLLPEEIHLRVLNHLRHRPEGKAEYREILRYLAQDPQSGYQVENGNGAVSVRNWNNSITTRMVRRIVNPLQSQGLLEIVDLGRQKGVRLTSRGRLFAAIGGFEEPEIRTLTVAPPAYARGRTA
jgi:hypothetical protein